MSHIFKPLLCATVKNEEDLSKLSYPLIVFNKYDGIRCLSISSKAISRSLKDIPNRYIQSIFSRIKYIFDGELTVGPGCDPNCFKSTSSLVMSIDKEVGEDLYYNVFDILDEEYIGLPYKKRLKILEEKVLELGQIEGLNIKVAEYSIANSKDDVLSNMTNILESGYEGIILRSPDAKYKYGRATFNDNIIYRYKLFEDSEATVIDFLPLMKNSNPPIDSPLGTTTRSTKKSGLEPQNTLGSITCKTNNTTFNIGTGFTNEERDYYWNNKEKYIGKLVKYKFFNMGEYNEPRFPVFLGFRDKIDT